MRNITYTLVLTLILIGVIKLVLPEPQVNKELVQQFWVNKTFASSSYDVVVAGDSRVYRGVSITDMNEGAATNFKGINIGYSSAGFSDEYLDFALSKFNPESNKKILFLGLTPHSLTLEAFKNESLNENLDAGKFDQFRYRYLSTFLGCFAPYSPIEMIEQNELNYKQTYHEDGWVSSYYLKPDSNSALRSYKKVFSEYQVSDTAINSFLKKIKSISANGVHVVVFRPPSTSDMRQLEDSLNALYNEDFLKKELKSLSVTYLDFADSSYTTYDGSHLHQNAARKLSIALGKKINEIH